MTDQFNEKAAYEKRKDNAIGLVLTLAMMISLGCYGWYAAWLMGGGR